VLLKEQLAQKVRATYEAMKNRTDASFLSAFGTLKPGTLPETDGPPWDIVMDLLADIRAQLAPRQKPFPSASLPQSGKSSRSFEMALLIQEFCAAHQLRSPLDAIDPAHYDSFLTFVYSRMRLEKPEMVFTVRAALSLLGVDGSQFRIYG
jgi:hypothetical protein